MRRDKKKGAAEWKTQIDWASIWIPLCVIAVLCIFFVTVPDQSAELLDGIRGFLGDDCGLYYAVLGVGMFGCSIYFAFSKYGRIRLGKEDVPGCRGVFGQYPVVRPVGEDANAGR